MFSDPRATAYFTHLIDANKLDKDWKSKNIRAKFFVTFGFYPLEQFDEPMLFWDYRSFTDDENDLILWATISENRTQSMKDQIAYAF